MYQRQVSLLGSSGVIGFFSPYFKGKFFSSLAHIAKVLASLMYASVQVPLMCDVCD